MDLILQYMITMFSLSTQTCEGLEISSHPTYTHNYVISNLFLQLGYASINDNLRNVTSCCNNSSVPREHYNLIPDTKCSSSGAGLTCVSRAQQGGWRWGELSFVLSLSGLDRVGAAWLCSGWSGVNDVDGMKLPPGHPMALSAACPVSLTSNTAMHVAWPLVVTLVTLGEPHPHH